MSDPSVTQAASRGERLPTGVIARTRYVVGIDLGTTNTALAYIDRRSGRKARDVRPFDVPQLTEPGITQDVRTLPSAVYVREGQELSAAQVALPWSSGEAHTVVGELARKRGTLVPDRLVTSAKSWLCHPGVDRRAAILPWGAPEEVERRSPVQIESLILSHLRDAWNHTVAADDDARKLEDQDIVVTIPASFDEVARELTLDAIRNAGLEALLIEEPQAALYSWIAAQGEEWKDHVEVGQTVLVCDVGGGTTDFSLIAVTEDEDGEPGFERTAVGDHLLLGGDNMDLALARGVEATLKKPLDVKAWTGLVQACRDAKERLLSGDEEQVKVAVAGRGRKLIGGTISATVQRAQVTESILEGFFPLDPGDAPPEQKVGLKEFGLPFETDPAITRHLRSFLRRHGEDGALAKVDHVLFNGGVFKTQVLRERVLDALAGWQERPAELTGSDLDLAVSRGAAYYGLVRRGKGTRIKSGAGRAYYLEVGTRAKDAQRSALCLIPRGLEEGSVITIGDHAMKLKANRPVVFPFHTSTVRDDTAGQVVTLDPMSFQELSPLHTVVRTGKKRTARMQDVPVELVARYTELGTLEMWCQAKQGEKRWRLELDTRPRQGEGEAGGHAEASPDQELPTGGAFVDPAKVEAAQAHLRDTFELPASQGQRPLEKVAGKLEEILETSREAWPVPVIRQLLDALLEVKDTRTRSAFHEARWWNLAGFCLRPGFGATMDPFRVSELWKLQLEGIEHRKAQNARLEWCVAFRRISGGLKRGQQEILFAPMQAELLGHKKGKSKQELAESWRLAASLEHLSAKKKRKLGNHLLELLEKGKAPPRWGPWAMGRFGGRVPLYGPLDRLVSPEVVAGWVKRLLALKERSKGENVFALVQMSRLTGDRGRDIPADVRSMALKRLEAQGLGARALRPLREVVQAELRTQQEFYGDSVPIGLSLGA